MKIIDPVVELVTFGKSEILYDTIVDRVSKIARICYRSENVNAKNYELVNSLYKSGHHSVFEHVKIATFLDWEGFKNDYKSAIIHKVNTFIYHSIVENLGDFITEKEFKNIFGKSVGRRIEDLFERINVSFPFITEPLDKNMSLRDLIYYYETLTRVLLGSIMAENNNGFVNVIPPSTPEFTKVENERIEVILKHSKVMFSEFLYREISDHEELSNFIKYISKEIKRILAIAGLRALSLIISTLITLINKSLFSERYFVTAKKYVDDINDTLFKSIFNKIIDSTFSNDYVSKNFDKSKITGIMNDISERYKEHNEHYCHICKIINGSEYGIYTFYIETNRGVLAEFTRHRNLVFTAESTRYVNYSNTNKYGDMCFTDTESLKGNRKLIKYYKKIEKMYNKLIKSGLQPQLARAILPNGLVCRMYVTGTFEWWLDFIRLRNANGAHPDIKRISDSILHILDNERNYYVKEKEEDISVLCSKE